MLYAKNYDDDYFSHNGITRIRNCYYSNTILSNVHVMLNHH